MVILSCSKLNEVYNTVSPGDSNEGDDDDDKEEEEEDISPLFFLFLSFYYFQKLKKLYFSQLKDD